MNKLTVSLPPHIHTHNSVAVKMWTVVIALLPVLGVAIYEFGLQALWVILTCVVTCLLTEWIITQFFFHTRFTLLNGSAVITGLLLAFNLPSILPLWMAVIGSVVAIGIGKMSFGGLGCNIWNPALVGRVFLLLSFPAAMTTWPTVDIPSASTGATAFTGATLLNDLNHGVIQVDSSFMDLAIGHMNGSLGETGSIAIILGLVILLVTKTVTWHIPVSVLASAAFFSWIFGGNPLLDILAGGLLLGAVFMATDYVTSPMTGKGQLIFGFMIGAITMVIRRFGAYPEGVSFAILLMNSFVPLIDRFCRPSVTGDRERRKLP